MEIVAQLIQWTKLKIRIIVAQPKLDFYFHEREIWWASLGINIGFEQNGKNELYERPVLILRKFNKNMFWALPLTSKNRQGSYYFTSEYSQRRYTIILSQLRLMSSKRLLRKIRTLPMDEFINVKNAIKSLL